LNIIRFKSSLVVVPSTHEKEQSGS
jgi:hypothetical protein